MMGVWSQAKVDTHLVVKIERGVQGIEAFVPVTEIERLKICLGRVCYLFQESKSLRNGKAGNRSL